MLVPAAQKIVINNTIWFSLSVLFVVARVFTRKFIVNNVGWDDYFSVLATLVAAGTYTSHMQAVYYGVGRPFESLTPDEMTWSLYLTWQTVLLYHLTLTLVKLSIVIQYMRVFSTTSFQWTFKIALGIVVAYGLSSVLGQAFMCIPVNSFWDMSIEGKCINKKAFWFSTSALNIVTDIMITLMPLPLIKDLKLPRRARIALLGVFVVGSIVTLASVVRLKGLYKLTASPDPTNDAVDVVIWTNIEVSLATICAAVPPLKPLMIRLFPSLKASIGSSAGGTGSKTGGGRSSAAMPQGSMSGSGAGNGGMGGKKSMSHHHHVFAVSDGERTNSRAGSDECQLVHMESLGSKEAIDKV